MNADVKKKWVAALRSGDYTQTKGVLLDARTGRSCCLGVLTLLAEEAGVCSRGETVSNHRVTCVTFDGENNVLPESVMKWAGVTDQGVRLPSEDRPLWSLNDTACWTFAQIANAIEAQL